MFEKKNCVYKFVFLGIGLWFFEFCSCQAYLMVPAINEKVKASRKVESTPQGHRGTAILYRSNVKYFCPSHGEG